jgi:nitrate/nitrite transporter NarK
MAVVLFNPFMLACMSPDMAWLLAVLVPAALCVVTACRWVTMAAVINAPSNYILSRFFIGCAGATFVIHHFWGSLMLAPNIVGTASACAAGWGNLGGA